LQKLCNTRRVYTPLDARRQHFSSQNPSGRRAARARARLRKHINTYEARRARVPGRLLINFAATPVPRRGRRKSRDAARRAASKADEYIDALKSNIYTRADARGRSDFRGGPCAPPQSSQAAIVIESKPLRFVYSSISRADPAFNDRRHVQ